MSGLNAGYELDHELGDGEDDIVQLMFGDTTPGDVPELQEGIEIVTTVRDKIADLNYLKSDIQRAGGMSKTFALEAERLIPGFLNDDRPVGYFSMEPTRTQLSETFLAIEEEEKSLISRIWEAIKAFVQKVVDWLKKLVERFLGEKEVEQAEETYKEKPAEFSKGLDQMTQGYAEPKNILDRVTRLAKDPNSDEFREYIRALEERLTKGDEKLNRLYQQINQDNFLYAIATGSDVVDQLVKIGMDSDKIVTAFSQFNKTTMGDVVDMEGSKEEIQMKTNSLSKAIASISKSYSEEGFHKYELGLKSRLNRRETAMAVRNMPPSKLYAAFGKTFRSQDVKAFRSHLAHANDNLLKVRDNVMSFTMGGYVNTKQRDQAGHRDINQLITQLYTELRGAMMLVTYCFELLGRWSTMAKTLSAYSEDFKRRVQAGLDKLDEESKKSISEYFDIAYEEPTDGAGAQ